MAAYVKGLDPNHLLTLGEEGFYSTSTSRLSANPGASSAPAPSVSREPSSTCLTPRRLNLVFCHPALSGCHVTVRAGACVNLKKLKSFFGLGKAGLQVESHDTGCAVQRLVASSTKYCLFWHAANATWPAGEGQDFIADHSSPNIDFATIHSWVDNWAVRANRPLLKRT